MIYGVVLAGGIGKRMGNEGKPKQFLTIGKKPIIIHTIEKFYINSRFEKIIVLCPEKWVAFTKDLIAKHLPDQGRIVVIEGGETRNGTIMNAISYIKNTLGDDDAIVVTHDAVRPFVTQRILDDNINSVLSGNVCDTVMPATDTIVKSKDGSIISEIPDRSQCYQGQTPQSFSAKRFEELYLSLTDDEKSVLTDAVKVFVMKGVDVQMILGETFNIKVTYPYDLRLAETLLEGEEEC